MTDALAILDHQYEGMIDDVFGARSKIERELGLEDEYQDVVFNIIRRAGAEEELAAYVGSDAFSGGAANLLEVLDAVQQMVASATRAAGFQPRPFVCRLWPDPGLNARVVETEGGAVILINTGLLVFLRLAAQYAASSMASITGAVDAWGPDKIEPTAMSERFTDRLRSYRAGADVRDRLIVEVIRGPREDFRRALNHFGVAYIVAHEVGHVVQRTESGTGALSLASVLSPASEQDEIASQIGELTADTTAYRILREPPIAEAEPPVVVAMGPMLVSGIQSALWWMDRADGSQDFGWSHPAPDIRIAGAVLELAPESRPRHHAIANQFNQWMHVVFGIDQSLDRAKEHDP